MKYTMFCLLMTIMIGSSAEPNKWYAYGPGVPDCAEWDSPAKLINEYHERGMPTGIREYKMDDGTLYRVDIGKGKLVMAGVISYYRDQQRCINEQVTPHKKLLDKYQ